MKRFIRFWMTAGLGRRFLSSTSTATFAGSRTASAMTAITPTTMYEATIQPWSGWPELIVPSSRPSCQPDASVHVTSVGMMSNSFGMRRVVSSTRAGIPRRPRIGPRTKPRKRSNEVHRPPAATWKNSSAHSLFATIAATSATRTTATTGRPRSGTTWKSGRGGAATAAAGASSATSAMGARINRPAPMHGMSDAREVDRTIYRQLPARRRDGEIAALATRQHGVIARVQLVEIGLSLDAIDYRVKLGRLQPLHRGVYAVGHRALTRHGRWMAAVLAGGPGAVLRRPSAAALWGIREGAPARVEIAAPRDRRRPAIAVQRIELPDDERDEHNGIPVTTPARTLLDLAALLDEHRLTRAAERAETLRLTSPTSLAALVDRYPRRPGTPNLKRLIEDHRIVPTTTANDFERGFLTFLDANGLPRPLINESLDPNTTPDFRWPNHRLIVELDGFETHGTRQAFERDRARDRRLLADGWRVARITQRQLDDDPDGVAAELTAILRSATTAAPAPPRDPRTPAR